MISNVTRSRTSPPPAPAPRCRPPAPEPHRRPLAFSRHPLPHLAAACSHTLPPPVGSCTSPSPVGFLPRTTVHWLSPARCRLSRAPPTSPRHRGFIQRNIT